MSGTTNAPGAEVAGGALGTSIGTVNEGHLRASLKQRYVEPGDLVEVGVDGYVVDILRGDGDFDALRILVAPPT